MLINNSKMDPTGRPDQYDMFSDNESPVMAACGMGVDSVAMIIEMVERKERIDVVLFADTGSEKKETIEYVPIFKKWLDEHNIPFHIVRYEPKNFKNWPPYRTLEENCITNGTLPSIAFGFGSCSLKWKVAPQNKWTENWDVAKSCWASGGRITKLIGYDCSPQDIKRYAEREGHPEDPKYIYRYPLREWRWIRENCINRIKKEGLPIPVKSSCFFCTAMKPHEVDLLDKKSLRRIVLMEARAAPRLTSTEGLWRKRIKGNRGGIPKPGSITEYIKNNNLISENEIDWIIKNSPKELVSFQDENSKIDISSRNELSEWLQNFDKKMEELEKPQKEFYHEKC